MVGNYAELDKFDRIYRLSEIRNENNAFSQLIVSTTLLFLL